MLRVTAVGFVMLLASAVWAGESPTPKELVKSPEALKAEIEAFKPEQLAWQEIQWKTCLLEAFAESRVKKKPVFLWVVGQGEGLGRL